MFELMFAAVEWLLDALDGEGDAADGAVTTHAPAGEVMFGGGDSTVQFPDGSTVTNPNTDAQGQVYPSRGDYLQGTNGMTPSS